MKFFNNDNGEAIGETGIAQASKYKKCHMKLGKKVARYQIGCQNLRSNRNLYHQMGWLSFCVNCTAGSFGEIVEIKHEELVS
ncbi:hypothetical protein T03_10693 [Trichinella britovi]|uniref:Uncharacterized protein n=1 Tax=Trichinella britovi TaxID=45882 RepID=A0A0V1CXC9_TRIBR|nr:hypothetical protein T03_10693 [Trichinella britovi]